jgi:multiple sugar transport system substrate-binding protein
MWRPESNSTALAQVSRRSATYQATPHYALTLAACDGGRSDAAGDIVDVWAHAGQESERRVLREQVARFNARQADMQSDIQVRLTLIPEGSYNAQLQAAAVAGDLPDLLEFDGPFLYSYVWQGRLQPLDALLPEGVQADLLPSIIEQGTYHGRLWSVGTFDSGLGLYADRVQLEQAGIRIPDLHSPWNATEFDDALKRLAALDADGQVLDLKLNYAGEWYTYGLSPLIQSAGGDLIDRTDYARAEGVLDGQSAVGAMRQIQSWIIGGRVDPNIDDAAFATRRVALALGGHWNYPHYSERLGDDLLLLPLPDLGQGPKTGQGSWCWAVTADSRLPAGRGRLPRLFAGAGPGACHVRGQRRGARDARGDRALAIVSSGWAAGPVRAATRRWVCATASCNTGLSGDHRGVPKGLRSRAQRC